MVLRIKNAKDAARHRTCSVLVGDCILDALHHHNIHEVGAQDVLPESFLLEQGERPERRPRMAARTWSAMGAGA